MSKAIGDISLKCVVERDGTLSNIEILDSDEPILDEEVIRVLKEMKGWCPGMKIMQSTVLCNNLDEYYE